MSKKKDPPGYPGDEAIERWINQGIEDLREQKGMSPESLQVLLGEAERSQAHPFLGRSLALVVRQLREAKKMSRQELSERSGLPLRFVNQLERAKKRDIAAVDLVRLAMALDHPIGDFAKQIEDEQQRLKSGK